MYRFIIKGRLGTINEWISKVNRNRYVGAKYKRDQQRIVELSIMEQLGGIKFKGPITLHYDFFEKNDRRDQDNVEGFAHKVIQDALVVTGTVEDDGWKWIRGNSNSFYVDKEDPRIEVYIYEEGE